MDSNIECRDFAQQWVNNTETGYMIKTFPFGSNSFADTFESTCYEFDQVNKVSDLPQWRILEKDAVPTILIHRKHQADVSKGQSVLIWEDTREKVGWWLMFYGCSKMDK